MSGEGLTIFGLGPRETDIVVTCLIQTGQWDWGGMIYDCDASLLMTTTDHAKGTVMKVLAEMSLMPESEMTYSGE